MDPSNYWFIRLRETGSRGDKKRPADSWGGHGQEFETANSVFTYKQTLEMDHSRFGVVGYRGEHRLIVIDADCYKMGDFEKSRLQFPAGNCGLVESVAPDRESGFHFYIFIESEQQLHPNFDWIDVQDNDHVVSPWHCEGYELLHEPELTPFDIESVVDQFEYDGESLVIGERQISAEPVEVPDSAPDELPLCARTLAHIRQDSDKRNQYTADSGPFSVDTHLGQVLIANGYDLEDTDTVFAEYPLPDGYNQSETRDQLQRLIRKHKNGDLHPPYAALEPEVDIDECDCAIHGSERVSFIPTADLTWDWQQRRSLTMENAYERTQSVLEDALQQETDVLIEALPGMGKSRGAVKAVAETGEPATILTGRGHKEMYRQYEQWCEEDGLESARLPVFTQECPTVRGDHGDEIQAKVMDLYDRGVTPSMIHGRLDLPCTEDDQSCPYQEAWSSNALDTADVLIGHYTHAHVTSAVQERTVIIDEFDEDAFQIRLGANEVQDAVNRYLDKHPELPFANISDAKEATSADFPVELIPDSHEGVDIRRDTELAFDDGNNIYAAHAFVTIAFGETQGDIQRATVNDYECVYHRENEAFWMLNRPRKHQHSNGVVCLDGTPVKELWELNLDTLLNHRIVLEDRREEYITDARNMAIVQTNSSINTVGIGGYNVDSERTHELLDRVEKEHGTEPGIVTHPTAVEPLDLMEYKIYGNLLGSNELKHSHVGVVTHSSHYGDEFIKRWCGYANRAFKRDGKGTSLDYGRFGNKGLMLMREAQVAQGILRFGRDNTRTWVYVDTAGLPDWLPVTDIGDFYHQDGKRQVLKAVAHSDEPIKTSTVADQVSLSVQHTKRLLDELQDDAAIVRKTVGQTSYWGTGELEMSTKVIT